MRRKITSDTRVSRIEDEAELEEKRMRNRGKVNQTRHERCARRTDRGTGHFPLRMRGEKERPSFPYRVPARVHGRVLKRQETPRSPTRSKGSSGRRVHRKGRKERRKKMITFVSRGLHARCLSRSDFRSYSTVAYTRNHQVYLSLSLSLLHATGAFSFPPRIYFTVKAATVKGDCSTSRVSFPILISE